jgi:hypothetical protein
MDGESTPDSTLDRSQAAQVNNIPSRALSARGRADRDKLAALTIWNKSALVGLGELISGLVPAFTKAGPKPAVIDTQEGTRP